MDNRHYKGQVSAWWWAITALSAVVLVLYLFNAASDKASFPAALATIPGLGIAAVVALLVWIALDKCAHGRYVRFRCASTHCDTMSCYPIGNRERHAHERKHPARSTLPTRL